MDRDNRLSQIKETDLTESRLNEEFVTWLKTKGLNWLLLVLLALLGWMGWNLWQQKQAEARDVAWEELAAATLPVSLEEVAVRHGAIDSVAAMAYLSAGDRYLSSIQNGVRFDRTPDQIDFRLDAETRTEFLDAADAAYRNAISAIEAAGRDPNGELSPLMMAAWFGRAAIAESRGDLEATEAALRKGRDVAGARYPKVVVWADRRIEDLPNLANPLPIPKQSDLPARETLAPLPPSIADDLMRELMAPPPVAEAPAADAPTPEAPAADPSAAPATGEPSGG
jgi:hypothetical protein